MAKTPSTDQHDTDTGTATSQTYASAVELIDHVMIANGHGTKPGDGVGAILRHVAIQMGVPVSTFTKVENDIINEQADKAKADAAPKTGDTART